MLEVVATDKNMAGAACPARPGMLRKFAMGLVIRQGRMGGRRPLRQAVWPGEYDVQRTVRASPAMSRLR